MSVTYYTEREYQALQQKLKDAQTRVAALEEMQPAWVPDRWLVVAALAELWKALGVNHQTAAMQAVRDLKGTSP